MFFIGMFSIRNCGKGIGINEQMSPGRGNIQPKIEYDPRYVLRWRGLLMPPTAASFPTWHCRAFHPLCCKRAVAGGTAVSST
jgi:hypothetical protein